MASLVLSGDTSGSITVAAPAVAGSNTQTLVNVTGTLAPVVSGTAVTASGTSVDFTDIPSWAKRITVMFSGVSTNGSSNFQVQLGSGSFTTSGYSGSVSNEAGSSGAVFSAGFVFQIAGSAGQSVIGIMSITLLTLNTWVETSSISDSGATTALRHGNGSIALSGTLDRVRITTVNGTDTFDAGTINIIYE